MKIYTYILYDTKRNDTMAEAKNYNSVVDTLYAMPNMHINKNYTNERKTSEKHTHTPKGRERNRRAHTHIHAYMHVTHTNRMNERANERARTKQFESFCAHNIHTLNASASGIDRVK